MLNMRVLLHCSPEYFSTNVCSLLFIVLRCKKESIIIHPLQFGCIISERLGRVKNGMGGGEQCDLIY